MTSSALRLAVLAVLALSAAARFTGQPVRMPALDTRYTGPLGGASHESFEECAFSHLGCTYKSYCNTCNGCLDSCYKAGHFDKAEECKSKIVLTCVPPYPPY